MTVIVNPAGRFVILDDQKQVDYWLEQTGFRKATKEEETDFLKKRTSSFMQKQTAEDLTKGIYLSTVSVGGKDGYGIAAEMLIKELGELGIPVLRYYNNQKVAILFHNPYGITHVESPYRIIYTMFESTKIPDDWIDYLKAANEVWLPSKWCASVFEKAGIKTKVVPLGYDDRTYTYFERHNKRKAREDFVFLHYNAFIARKGFLEVFNAFKQEFKKDEPVKMIFKTTLHNAPLPIPHSQYPNIDVIFDKMSEKQLLELIHQADCFVFPSRGEGFGITPLECMATGCPAIVPNAHGISEYFNKDYMYEVEIEGMCPALYSRYKEQNVGEMYICSVADLRKKMRYAYEHQDENLDLGRRASEYVKQWTFRNTAKLVKVEYENILSKPLPAQHITNVLPLEMVK